MLSWFSHWLELRYAEKDAKRMCPSCEILKHELNMMRLERDKILDKLINLEVKPFEEVRSPQNKVIIPRHHKNWKIQQQMLEDESRKTNLLKMELGKKLDSIVTKDIKTVEQLEEAILNGDKSNAV